MLLLLKLIDPATGCWVEEKQLVITDTEEVIDLLRLEHFEFNAVYDLEPAAIRLIEQRYGFAFEAQTLRGSLCVLRRTEPFRDNLHTGRELLLMLAGEKPCAAFCEDYPRQSTESFIPESYFAPYVEQGLFTKMVVISKTGNAGALRRMLYAARGEEWRLQSYVMLWKLAEKYGWNDGFEKVEGYLLGYERELEGAGARVVEP